MNLGKARFLRKVSLLLILFAACLPLLAIDHGAGQTIPTVYLPIVLRPAQPTATNTPLPTATTAPATNTPIPTQTAQPTATNTPEPTATTVTLPTPTATSSVLLYICDHDAYNCSDFDTQAEAQTVFNYCAALGFGDIHKLDQNNDGEACESLPQQ